jgi:hypothetical protein
MSFENRMTFVDKQIALRRDSQGEKYQAVVLVTKPGRSPSSDEHYGGALHQDCAAR